MIAVVIIPVLVALIYVMKKKTGMYTGVLFTCGGLAVGWVLYFVLLYAATGAGIADSISSTVGDGLESNPELAQAMYAMLNNVADYSMVSADVAVVSLTDYLTGVLVCAVPAFAAGFSAVFGLILYLAVRAVIKKTGHEVHPIRKFKDFRLPKYFGRCSAVCYIVVLIGMLNGWQNFDIVYAVVAALLGSIYFVQGICFAEYFLEGRIKSPAARIMIYVAVTLILYQILLFIGIFEQLAKMRRKMDVKRSSGE